MTDPAGVRVQFEPATIRGTPMVGRRSRWVALLAVGLLFVACQGVAPSSAPSTISSTVDFASPSDIDRSIPSASSTAAIVCRIDRDRCRSAIAAVESAIGIAIPSDQVAVAVDACQPGAPCPSTGDVIVAIIARGWRLGDRVVARVVNELQDPPRVGPLGGGSAPEWLLPILRSAADIP